jgi:hypothetical protein
VEQGNHKQGLRNKPTIPGSEGQEISKGGILEVFLSQIIQDNRGTLIKTLTKVKAFRQKAEAKAGY